MMSATEAVGPAQPQGEGVQETQAMHTWFLKEVCWTGSSAAREMLLSRMKKRIRLVKIVSLTMRWHWRRNLYGRGTGGETSQGRQGEAPVGSWEPLSSAIPSSWQQVLVGLKWPLHSEVLLLLGNDNCSPPWCTYHLWYFRRLHLRPLRISEFPNPALTFITGFCLGTYFPYHWKEITLWDLLYAYA